VSPHWLAATTAIELTSDYLLRKSIGLNFSIDHLLLTMPVMHMIPAPANKNWGIPMQKCGRPKNMRNVEVRLAQVHYQVRPTEDDHCDHRGHGRSACTSDRRPPMTLGNMRELV
jgi:hypothetical protein